MIATGRRDSLPKGFAYPIRAKRFCEEIGDIPQSRNMSLEFRWRDEYWASKWQRKIDSLGEITLVEVQCTAPWYEWRTYIYSVPVNHSEAAREFLLGGPLKEIGAKLKAAGDKSDSFVANIKYCLGKKNDS